MIKFFMAKFKFDLQKYKELLAKQDSFPNDISLFSNSQFIELCTLEGKVEIQVYYENRHQYSVLIQNYLNKLITPHRFRADFTLLKEEDIKKAEKILENFEELSNFWIDSDLNDFSSSFETMYDNCLSIIELEDEGGAMMETDFRNSIEKHFFKIQKYLNE